MNWPRNDIAAYWASVCFFLGVMFASGGAIYYSFDPLDVRSGHVIASGFIVAWTSFHAWTFFWVLEHVGASLDKQTKALAP